MPLLIASTNSATDTYASAFAGTPILVASGENAMLASAPSVSPSDCMPAAIASVPIFPSAPICGVTLAETPIALSVAVSSSPSALCETESDIMFISVFIALSPARLLSGANSKRAIPLAPSAAAISAMRSTIRLTSLNMLAPSLRPSSLASSSHRYSGRYSASTLYSLIKSELAPSLISSRSVISPVRMYAISFTYVSSTVSSETVFLNSMTFACTPPSVVCVLPYSSVVSSSASVISPPICVYLSETSANASSPSVTVRAPCACLIRLTAGAIYSETSDMGTYSPLTATGAASAATVRVTGVAGEIIATVSQAPLSLLTVKSALSTDIEPSMPSLASALTRAASSSLVFSSIAIAQATEMPNPSGVRVNVSCVSESNPIARVSIVALNPFSADDSANMPSNSFKVVFSSIFKSSYTLASMPGMA